MSLELAMGDNFLVPNASWAVLGLFLVVALGCSVLWIWSLVNALAIPDQQWSAAGQSKLLWVLLIVFLGLLGSLLYVGMARPSLRRGSAPSPATS